MNDDLCYTRLRWHNGVGLAKKHGTTVTVATAPDLGRGPVHYLMYTPENGESEVAMGTRDSPRRMHDDEIHAADALLERLTSEEPDSCRYDEPWKEGRC